MFSAHWLKHKSSQAYAGLWMTVMIAMPTITHANELAVNNKILTVTPEQCIALHKGQQCYLDVTFRWQLSNRDNVCLIDVDEKKLIQCWQQQSSGEISFEFQSDKSKSYVLRLQQSEAVIDTARINVAWVYSSSRRAKASWRLF
ncbi:MAG: DUF3019 domain-containing protein [Psychrobium sp.]|nr:DUF3019 domain-containing protein [Psychrobium sp.]